MSASEEKIIQNRLLMDPAVKAVKKCLRQFHATVAALNQHRSSAESQLAMESFLVALSGLETSILKHQLLHDMNLRETSHYIEDQQRIEREIVNAREDIESLKLELVEAQRQRNNRLEYDAKAREIQQYESRARKSKKIDVLKAEISKFEAEQRAHKTSMEFRKRQIQAALNTLHTIQEEIADTRDAEAQELSHYLALLESKAPQVVEEEDGLLNDDDRDNAGDPMET
ncbi:Tho complex subunit 7-domain-containing protein [Polychytrium aggregatum]|uniref:Tho complex subunit 7-domain-containing protein n=1 Tax=Polychytrium aggregatum TaxID=110093 RepID=UPI0022FE3DD2|nr:Tho complex subunit 7-domain-containing protein [Polychytrium aggregatum]KAI9193406.1 Tho complex subunit 7-domain-containing protein [Polychytrium aggregatum]